MITIKNHNVVLANLPDKKLECEFAEEKYFDEKVLDNSTIRGETLIRLLQSNAIMASGFCTISLPKNTTRLCDRLKLLLQNKQHENNSDLFYEEIVTIVDNLFE